MGIEVRKEYYDTYKALGICTCCGKNKAEPNRVLCLECAIRDASRKKSYDKKRKAAYLKRKKELCDAFGICTSCCKKEKYKGKQCIDCYLKRKRKYAEKLAKEGKISRSLYSEYGLCSFCGKPVVEGKKVCEKHLKTTRERGEYARQFVDYKNHIWKMVQDVEVITLQQNSFINHIG